MKPTKKPPLNETSLHALADNQIDAQQRERLTALLAADPAAAQAVRDYQLINRELHSLYDNVADEPIPPQLLLTRPGRANHWVRTAAVAGWLLLGSGAGWFAHEWLRPPPATQAATSLVQEAVLAHAVYTPEVRHPVEVNADQESHLLAWLSKRLNAEIRAPQLTSLGFELLGGRLLPAGSGPAAQFMYQDTGGQRLTLFVRVADSGQQDTAFQFIEGNGIRAFYWIEHNLGYALIGNLSKSALTQVARAVYEQLSL